MFSQLRCYYSIQYCCICWSQFREIEKKKIYKFWNVIEFELKNTEILYDFCEILFCEEWKNKNFQWKLTSKLNFITIPIFYIF